VGLQKAGQIFLFERIATKLNADKTRFNPEPVGVLLAFRFWDRSRPRLAYDERTPRVPECQYPFQIFPKIAASAAWERHDYLNRHLQRPVWQ
jgi:hypothetical protein